MNKFNTPEEAITACNKELERAWIEYSSIRQFDSLSTGALKYAFKEVFTAGYMSGVSSVEKENSDLEWKLQDLRDLIQILEHDLDVKKGGGE
jgi:hypothetical protein